MRQTAEDFLRSHIAYTGDDCVIWPFAKMGGRGPVGIYGSVKIGGVQKLAHRCMCTFANGDPPTRRHEAAHSCHNPACINPRHLRWATRLENEADKTARGSRPKGEQHTQSRLCENDVRGIRTDARQQREIAKSYGVAQSQIWAIKNRKTWKHVQD